MSGTERMTKARSETAAPPQQVDLVRGICAHIDEQEGEPTTLAALADQAGISPWHLQRVFKRVMGVSPRDYADACRSERFRAEHKSGESVASASPARFLCAFHPLFFGSVHTENLKRKHEHQSETHV